MTISSIGNIRADQKHADAAPERFTDYDQAEFQKDFLHFMDLHTVRASLVVAGISCGGCVNRIESRLRSLEGVESADVNFTTSRLSIVWRLDILPLSSILKAISELGFQAHPYTRSSYRQALDSQRRKMLKQFVIALVPGMQIMMLSIALYLGEASDISAQMARFFQWIMLGLSIPVVFYSARAFFEPAVRALTSKTLNMDVPVSLGIGMAFVASVINTIRDSGAVYFDSVAMFVVLLLGARLLELGGRRKAASTTENMMSMVPESARRRSKDADGDSFEEVPVVRLRQGDIVRILPGERVPVDGVVMSGFSSVDRAIVTGESMPVSVSPGDSVAGGSINTDGLIDIEVGDTGAGSMISRLMELAARGQATRPNLGRIADTVASRFVAFVIFAACITGLAWWFAGDAAWAERMIAVLVVSCPCALSLATPAALSAGSNALLQDGVLITRPDAMETMAKLSDVCLDKTGTLTDGQMKLIAVHSTAGLEDDQCLAIAAALEQISQHPLAQALKSNAPASVPKIEALQLEPGRGVSGRIDGKTAAIGSQAFVRTCLEDDSRLNLQAPAKIEAAHTQAWLVLADELIAVFEFADTLRPEATGLLQSLAALHVTTHMLSGDSASVVEQQAGKLSMKHWSAQMSPADKLGYLQKLRAENRVSAMLGDGLNDMPILAAADLAVAVDNGVDVAKAQADVVLFANDIAAFGRAVALARRVRSVMHQNLTWAVTYNLCAIPLAAFGQLSPWQAAIGMSLSSLLVVGNSLRLLRGKVAIASSAA